jgi:hypothetical protein
MEYEPPSIVTGQDGREIYVMPDGSGLYVDEVREKLVTGWEERLKQPLQTDNLDELREKLERLKAEKEAAGSTVSETH